MLIGHPETVRRDDASEAVGVTCGKRGINFAPSMAMNSNARPELLGNILGYVGGNCFEDGRSWIIRNGNLQSG